MTDERKSLSATAKTFTMSAKASTWTPTFTLPPPPVETILETKMETIALSQEDPKPENPSPKITNPKITEDDMQDVVVHEDIINEEVQKEEVTDEDPREHLNIVFIGHVDAGKSTLSGNILYLMDMVDKRTIERYEKEAKERNRESWFLAFIMDTGEEEREKGKTVEVGRAHFETPQKRFTMLDAPGHKNYVPNMIQGAAQADVAILVISARKGEFETGFDRGGQTREHAMLAKTLGVDKLVVVINKMDEAGWKVERYEECVAKLKPFLKGCGYAVKKNVTFIPISGLKGDNVKDPLDASTCSWYTGPSLIGFLDQLDIPGRDRLAPVRIPVLDRYSERGTIVLGKVEAGTLTTGMKLSISPTNVPCLVQQVYINDQPVRTAKPGENVTMKVSSSMDEIQKGFVLCPPSKPCHHVTTFLAQLAMVDMLDHRPLFTAGYNAILHIHTLAVECVVVQLLRQVDKKTGQPLKKKVTFVRQNDVAIVQLRVTQSIAVETFETMPQMGRFTLRDEGKSIAIGKIIKLGQDVN